MEKVKILIVEDELLIAESLKIMLEGMGYEVPAIFTSGKETLDQFKLGFADIIIMDINLADDINGIETSIEIRKISTAPIIYITDSKDELLRKKAIYETNTVQFLTKPFSQLDISIAIDLAIKAIKGHDLALRLANSSSHLIDECIFVKEAQAYRKVMIADVMFLKANGSYSDLIFKLAGERKPVETKITFTENLSSLEEKLGFAKALIRVHRSFIININAVKKVQESRVWIEGYEIPVSKPYRNEIKERFRFI